MNRGPDWNRRLVATPGRLGDEFPSGPDRTRRVVRAGESRNEQRHHLIPHELVDQSIPLVHHPPGGSVEPRHKTGELSWGHALGQRRRSTDVGEQQ
jgi:hypothetical protein